MAAYNENERLREILVEASGPCKEILRESLFEGPHGEAFRALVACVGDVPTADSVDQVVRGYDAEALKQARPDDLASLVRAGWATSDGMPTDKGTYAVALLYLCPLGLY